MSNSGDLPSQLQRGDQSIYLVIYKVLLWSVTLKIVLLLYIFGASVDEKDTVSLPAALFIIVVMTLVFGVYSLEDHGLFVEILWIFSTYLESISMLPQYIYCYRDADNKCPLVSSYVFAMGGYQMVFGVSWGHHFLFRPYDLDVSSMISGFLGIVFFCDYLAFRVLGVSMLVQVCISVDDTIKEAEEAAWSLVAGQPVQGMDFSDPINPDVIGRREEIEMATTSSAPVEYHRSMRLTA
ncbi:KdelR [Symbiodinium sp. CCMP2456]|nr:KdelR [Symbiodinium sp. CCMP2456]